MIEHRLMDWKEMRNGSLRVEQHFITHKQSQRQILVGKNGSKIGYFLLSTFGSFSIFFGGGGGGGKRERDCFPIQSFCLVCHVIFPMYSFGLFSVSFLLSR